MRHMVVARRLARLCFWHGADGASQFAASPHAELPPDLPRMASDGLNRNMERCCDLAVGAPVSPSSSQIGQPGSDAQWFALTSVGSTARKCLPTRAFLLPGRVRSGELRPRRASPTPAAPTVGEQAPEGQDEEEREEEDVAAACDEHDRGEYETPQGKAHGRLLPDGLRAKPAAGVAAPICGSTGRCPTSSSVPPGATPDANRCTVSDTDPATCTCSETTRSKRSGSGAQTRSHSASPRHLRELGPTYALAATRRASPKLTSRRPSSSHSFSVTERRPSRKLSVGTDWKTSLSSCARRRL